MSHNAQTGGKIPVIELTRADFAQIPKVQSEMGVLLKMKEGHQRVAAKGDAGNWFVCYPKTKLVFQVRFIQPGSVSLPGEACSTALNESAVNETIALRERTHENANQIQSSES